MAAAGQPSEQYLGLRCVYTKEWITMATKPLRKTHTVTLDEVEDFTTRMLNNPWKIRDIARCPECGSPARVQCKGLPRVRDVHRARRKEAQRVVEEHLTSLRQKVENDFHIRYVADLLERMVCVTLDTTPEQAVVMFRYAAKRGEIQRPERFTDAQIRSAMRYLARHA